MGPCDEFWPMNQGYVFLSRLGHLMADWRLSGFIFPYSTATGNI